jgi:hypothetical protein
MLGVIRHIPNMANSSASLLRLLNLSKLALVCAACFATAAAAQETARPSTPPLDALIRNLRDTFNTTLVDTPLQGNVDVWVEPRLGDLIRRSHFRLPIHLEYGLTDYWSLRGEVGFHADNIFRSGGGFGVSHGAVGTKYRWQEWMSDWFDTATGLDVEFPIGNPHPRLHDDQVHYRPFIVVQRNLGNWEEYEVFASLLFDLSPHTALRRRSSSEVDPLDDFFRFTVGGLYRWRDDVALTFETTFEHNFPRRRPRENLFLTPGVIVDLPYEWTRRLSSGRWQVGLATDLGLLDADRSIRVRARVRWMR